MAVLKKSSVRGGLGQRNTNFQHARNLYYKFVRQVKTSSIFCRKPKMSSSNSHSSVFSNSSISSLSISNLCEIEDECLQTEFEATNGGHVDEYSDEEKAYLDELIADETWLEEYQ